MKAESYQHTYIFDAACMTAYVIAGVLLCSIWVQFVPYFLVGVGEVFTK